jgi:hypothetical protein
MAVLDRDSLEYLLQIDILKGLLPLVGTEQWQSLYVSGDGEAGRFGLWCALLDDDAVEHALANTGWDLMIGDGKPGFSASWPKGEEVTTYHRYGGREGVRALVHHRSFHGAFPSYCELDEEFRHYHDLAHDPARGLLLSFDDSGREVEVARIEKGHVSARLKYLRQYQAVTRQHLAIYVDSVRYSRIPLEDVGERHDEAVNERLRWSRDVVACDFRREYETFSRVLLKVILPPPPLEKAGVWPFDDEGDDPEVCFVIGVDQDGDNIEHTSNPDSLSNYFGANPGAPNYLTPVYFRREVLAKYYAEPERYTVSDGQLSCLALWSCQIDNNLESHVAVFLGDLGRDLPYEERLHWRQFNVPPEGGISETNFGRSFLAQFTEPEAPDLVFKAEYERFSTDWEAKYGWPFFLPLAPGDAHLLDTVRVPVANSQSEMDDQVLNLTKLVVDSLNEKEFAKAAADVPEGAKGIAKLEAFFASTDFAGGDSVVRFLRDLQLLRSTGSGHRKGSGYDKAIARLGVDPSRKPDAVARLLEEAVGVLRALRMTYIDERE